MKMLIRNLKFMLLLFSALSLLLITGILYQQHRGKTALATAAGENKAVLRERYATAGTILDRHGEILAQSDDGMRSYHKDPATARALLHVVGDYTHRVGNTIEGLYQGQLLGSGRNPFHQLVLDLSGKGLVGDNITLTIDAGLSKHAHTLLDGRRGAVVMMNWQTGDVLVAVSSPSTLPRQVIDWVDIPDTALYDRALMGTYAPGSIFKILTASAWLTDKAYQQDDFVDCGGGSTVAPDGASETGSGHGKVGLEEAFLESCNVYFGDLGVRLGRDRLLTTAEAFGFGAPLLADRRNVRTSLIEAESDPGTLSWLAIGQPNRTSRLQISPLQLAMTVSGIANNGRIPAPHFVAHLEDPLGSVYHRRREQVWRTILAETEARELTTLMVRATQKGTASAASIQGWTVAGKTGTVQVEDKRNTALYAGFIQEPEAPYALAVVVEEGGSGAKTAAPIAARLFREVVKRNAP